MADLTINSVSVPSAVVNGQTFSLDVSVTASADSVEDGSAYRLFVFVTSLLTENQFCCQQEASLLA
jgi:hypothetical protein